MQIMTIRAPEELRRELTSIATSMGMPRNALVLRILWDWIKKISIHARHGVRLRVAFRVV